MSNLNPSLRYTFKSVTGRTVDVTSRLGADSARNAAMIHLWGPLPDMVVPTRFGLGLDLISVKDAD